MSPLKFVLIGGLLSSFGFGISDFLSKKVSDRVGALRTLFYSQVVSNVFVAFFCFGRFSTSELTMPLLGLLLLCTLLHIVGYIFLYHSFKIGKLSIVSPISSAYVIFATLISFMFFGETFRSSKLFILAIIIIGIMMSVIDWKDLKDGLQAEDFAVGVPQALFALAIFSFSDPLWNSFLEQVSNWQIWVLISRGLLILILFGYFLVSRKGFQLAGVKQVRARLFWMGLFVAVGQLGQYWAFNKSVDTTSLIIAVSSTYPLVTAGLAFVLLKERLAVNQYIGVGLTMTGLLLMPFI